MHQQLGQQPINKDNKTWLTYTLCCKLNSENTASMYCCRYSSWELDSGFWGLWLFCWITTTQYDDDTGSKASEGYYLLQNKTC